MIISTLKDIQRYYSINPFFKKGVDYVLAHRDAPVGRYEIEGEDCFVMFVEGEKRPVTEAKLEVHNRYIDIQIVLDGVEGFGWKPRGACIAPQGGFDTERDILFFDDPYDRVLELSSDDVVVFFPEDGHAPLIGSGTVRKAIIKSTI